MVLGLVAVAVAAAALKNPSSSTAPAGGSSELTAESTPALGARFASIQKQLAQPGSKQEGDRGAADDEWLKHATPGNTIPSSAIQGSRADWNALSHRSEGSGNWRPLGPTWGKSLPNSFRDRSVYNSGTPDFSGRIAHVAIDPNCGRGGGDDDDDDDGGGGGCRLWIANAAGGGVWRTTNALSNNPSWRYLSMDFGHNSTASLELDPNDHRANTLWAGTGEPNACGSGCEAGVGIYRSRNGGSSWSGPFGQGAGLDCGGPATCNVFYNRGVGSIEVKPGNSNVMFAASGRALRGLSSACCGGVDAIIPGAAHFGVYRSLNGGQTWQLVHQGAATLCNTFTPDQVSLAGTPCSARGARRVMIDPVDPNTVYAASFASGIWRSRSNGDPNTWEQIMARVGPATNPATGLPITTERAEFDLVALPNGETRMYVGVGGGGIALPGGATTVPARFRRNDNVRTAPAATVAANWIDLTTMADNTPGASSFGYCDGQCVYDNYVFAPAGHFPNSGADADTVYLLGDNAYNENNWDPTSPRFSGEAPNCGGDTPSNTPPCGRSNGRGVALSTNAGVHFTDMTEDDRHDFYPGAQHPDHHAMTVNPRDWKQFFAVGDGGIIRSNGDFVDDSGDCTNPKQYTGARLTFCQLLLSRVPERLTTLNRGLRTVHFYQLNYSPHDPDVIVGGTQDNGSWENGDGPGSGTNSGPNPPVAPNVNSFPSNCRGLSNAAQSIWVNTNIADGGHNHFDIADPCFRLSGFQVGQTMVTYDPKNQLDMNWTSDTHFVFYGNEANAFVGTANDDRVHAHWLWSARQHVFRSMNQGRNPILTKATHREHCNIWYGDGDVNDNGTFEPLVDICDDWKPLGDPGPNGRLTSAAYGVDRQGGYTGVIERGDDSGTLWAATQAGRVFVSKNADDPNPAAVVFDRIDNDPTAANTPPRFVTAIYVDPEDSNHAWVAYSGFNAKTPGFNGHVFEVHYNPAGPNTSTFTMLDGNEPRDELGDIPATSIVVSKHGTIYVGTDYGCVKSSGDGNWSECGRGLPNMNVADMVYVRERNKIYAATHGQGVWELRFGGDDDD